MAVSFLSDSTPPARFCRRHPRAMEIVPSDPPVDHLKSRTDDRCISLTAFRRSFRPAAFAQAQKNMRGKLCDRWNQLSRDVGQEISPAAEASLWWRLLRVTVRDPAPPQARA